MDEIRIECKRLDDLKPAPYNPRAIDEKSYYGLGRSLEKFGLMAHIVWNERTGNIVGGHQRYRQLRERGVEETDVVVVNLDDQDEITLNLALNNRNIRGDFTEGAIEALRMTEARIGQSFTEIRLDELLDKLEKKKKRRDKRKEPKEEPVFDNPAVYEPGNALIRCPECGSMWKMGTNEVVKDGREGGDELRK